jgi:hypothetical protein
MRNIKLVSVHALALTALFFCGSEKAYGQANGMEIRNKLAVVPAAAAVTPNPDCTIIVPKNPLSAVGLATPYQLTATDPAQGPCNEANTAQSAFVQAGIFDPATGAISIYSPLVIDAGTSPAAAPVLPKLPANAIVALWFGYNANNLTLVAASGDDLADANCVNGEPGSVFTQFAYCNAPEFFRQANLAIANGVLKVPALGKAADGLACPTVRDFFVVDQDQSDNLPTTYLVTTNGTIAQYTQKNLAAFPGATTLGNPSDNRLTDVFLDGALHCTPWTAANLADPGQVVPALPLNELQARFKQATPVALVPGGDPMTLLAGNEDIGKVNRYRRGVDQPTADSFFDVSTARYCRQMLRIAPSRMLLDQAFLTNFKSPDAGAANTLFTFMAQRFVASYQILNCANLINQPDPITVTTDANGVAISATINTMTYSEEVQDIAGQKAADDAADSAARSLQTQE